MPSPRNHKHQFCTEHRDRSSSLANAVASLKKSGHRLTRPRQTLLNVLAGFPVPFSTDEAFHATQKRTRGAKIDLVTVYRSLSTFAELGILSRVEFGDGVVRYEMHDPSHHHHHFICQKCRRVEALNLCEVKKQENHLKASGYTQLTHRLEFFGVCPQCTK